MRADREREAGKGDHSAIAKERVGAIKEGEFPAPPGRQKVLFRCSRRVSDPPDDDRWFVAGRMTGTGSAGKAKTRLM